MLPTEVLHLGRPASARVELVGADERLEASVVARGTLTLLGYVPDDGPFDAFLALKVDGNFVSVTFDKGMAKEDMFDALCAALPPGYEAATPQKSASEVLIVTFLRERPARSTTPCVTFSCTDPHQRLIRVAKNTLRIEGQAETRLVYPSEAMLDVDGHEVRVEIPAGARPLETARRIRAALPRAYTAILALPLCDADDVTLTVVRRVRA